MTMADGVAIVGASENNFFTVHAMNNLKQHGYRGAIWPVNPNYESVFGYDAFDDVSQIEGRLDAVIVATAAHRCPGIVEQAVEAGCLDIVVVSDGFSERGSGGPGQDLERRLIESCSPMTRLVGPNCVGFADFQRGLCAIAEPVPSDVPTGDVSIISQSGALLSTLMASLIEDGVGLDYCVSMGNGAQLGLAKALEYVCDRGTSRAICVYAESLGNSGDELAHALQRCDALGIAVVMLKVGRSARTARITLTHTASVAGDDTLVDAFLEAHHVVRVGSLEELARTVAVTRHLRASQRSSSVGGVLFIGSSGGSAAVSSDLVERDGVRLARLGRPAARVLHDAAAPGSFLENPIDLVGRPGAESSRSDVYREAFSDPDVSMVVSPWTVIFPDEGEHGGVHRKSFELVAATARETGIPTIISSLAIIPWTDWVRRFRAANPAVLVVRGVETTIRALSHVFPAGVAPAETAAADETYTHDADLLCGEIEGRAVLESFDVPLVAGQVISEGMEVAAAVRGLQPPLAVKIELAGVSHKAAAGGVTLGCRTVDDVTAAIESSIASIRKGRDSISEDVRGILIEEMASGIEILVGLSRTDLGAFVTVAPGGTSTGLGTQSVTELLPVDVDTALESLQVFLADLRASSAGMLQAAKAIVTLSTEFLSGGLREYISVEINPLFVSDSEAVIADVLMVRGSATEAKG